MQRAASALSPELGSHGSAPLRWPSFNPDLTACLLGFALRFPSSGIGYIWPPNAVLVAALILLAPRVWPIALSFSLVAHGIAHSQDGVSPLAWLCLYAGNAVQALLAATIVRRLCDKPVRLNTLHNVVVFIVGAAFVAPAIASLIPPYFYVKMHWASSFWPAWGMRTLTNVVTTLTLVPPLLWLLRPERRGMNGLTLPRVVEFLILLTALLAVNSAAYMLPHPLSVGLPLALSASMPFFVWAAARFGVEALSTCLLTVAYVAINPPDEGTTGVATIVGVQMFVGIAVSPFMLLSAALEETRQSHRTKEALHRSETKTAAILRAIPDLMFLQTKDDGHRYVDY